MSLESSLQALAEAFEARKEASFANTMREVFEKARNLPPARRAEGQAALLDRVADSEPALAANIAVLVGAIVEDGWDARPLAEGIGAPLRRTLAAAQPMAAALREVERASDEDDDAIWVGHHRYAADRLRGLHETMPDAATALRSLDTWFRPVVASWTRCPEVLAQVQGDDELRAMVQGVGDASEGAHWIGQLLDTVVEAPFVVLAPEAKAGVELTLVGVSDCGQLTVLLSDALRELLAGIGATVPAEPEILAVMRGDGPQQGHGVYGADFHLYPWQAYDPEKKKPANQRFTWVAPGGSGDHSLPGDFQPRNIVPLHGRRVLLVLGPNDEEALWIRQISAARTFEALRASIRDLRTLDASEVERWYGRIEDALRETSPSAKEDPSAKEN